MSKSAHNLRLFDSLYWLVLLTFSICLSFFCLLSFEMYSLPVMVAYLSVEAALITLLEIHQTNYVSGQCLNQTSYSAFGGKHRRNIFTGHETRIYAHFLQFATFLEGFLLTEPFPAFQPKKVELIMTLFLAFFFGMFVPIKHIFSSQQELPELFEKEKDKETFEFYVRRPQKLTPRRPSDISPITQLPVLINYREKVAAGEQKTPKTVS